MIEIKGTSNLEPKVILLQLALPNACQLVVDLWNLFGRAATEQQRMPTSVYNLRGSRSTSTQGTPKKADGISVKSSANGSPSKKADESAVRNSANGSPLKKTDESAVRNSANGSPLKKTDKSPAKKSNLNSPVKKPNLNSPVKKSNLDSPLKKSNLDSPVKKSPLKRSPAKEMGSNAQSPMKKVRKTSILLEDIPQLPIELINVLSLKGNIFTLDDIAGMTEQALLEMIRPHFESTNKKEQGELKREMLTAWIRCLIARSKDPKTPLLWRDWVDCKVVARSRSISSDKLSALSRGELVRQRQSLKKSKGPVNRTITFKDLLSAKAKLTVLPVGKALKDKVEPSSLQTAKQGLKKVVL